MNNVATKEFWENNPMDKPKRIGIDLHHTQEQFSQLTRGIIPDEMDDRWFIYFDSDLIYFHRFWTGDGIYKAKLNKGKDGYSIKEFWAERNQKNHRNKNDKADIGTISFPIARVLLGN